MKLRESLFPKSDNKMINLQQGDCIQLTNQEEFFQVIGVDDKHKKCWVRQWPLLPSGSPVFEISTKDIASPNKKPSSHRVKSP